MSLTTHLPPVQLSSVRATAVASFVGTAYFALALIVLNFVQAGSYNAVRQPGSQLELGTGGWLLVVGFFLLALATLLLAYVLGATLGSFRAAPVILLTIDGAIGFVPAIFQTDAQNAALTTHGLLHNLGGLITFLLYVAAIVTSALRFSSSQYWRAAAGAARGWAIAAVCSFVLLLVLGGHNMFGLGERIALATFLSWMLYLSWFAMRSASMPDREMQPMSSPDATA